MNFSAIWEGKQRDGVATASGIIRAKGGKLLAPKISISINS